MWNCFVLAIFTLCSLQPSNAADLVFYKGSLDNTVSAPLSSPLPTFNSTLIDSTLPCLIYAFGYQGKKNGRATTSMIQAYVQTRKRNVFLANWEKEAASGLLGIPLGYALSAAPNAKKIGNQLGDAIVILLKAGLCLSFHLIGHSLGAHVMGYAGKRVRGAGKVVDRITGLDPARALHEGSFAMYTGVDRTCAKFVDIVHTDPGGYGYSNAAGTVDLWPNYVGSEGTQPGCPSGDYAMFTPEDLCSHDRSWQLYSESIGAPTSMPAAAASDADAWRAARSVAETTYLGELTSISARGNFYLTTNAQSLFARGEAGLIADTNESRKRRHSTALTRLLKYLR